MNEYIYYYSVKFDYVTLDWVKQSKVVYAKSKMLARIKASKELPFGAKYMGIEFVRKLTDSENITR